MPEGSKQAAILIATSFQAMSRVSEGRKETQVSDATVMILFASFYIEATLNYIADYIDNGVSMSNFLKKPFPGMQDKLAWFYNEYVARKTFTKKKQFFDNDGARKLRRKYRGFAELYKFRNDISHGNVNKCAASMATANRLRQNAKDIVAALYDATSKVGCDVPRITTHHEAIKYFKDVDPTIRCR